MCWLTDPPPPFPIFLSWPLQMLVLYTPYSELGIDIPQAWPKYSEQVDPWFWKVRVGSIKPGLLLCQTAGHVRVMHCTLTTLFPRLQIVQLAIGGASADQQFYENIRSLTQSLLEVPT